MGGFIGSDTSHSVASIEFLNKDNDGSEFSGYKKLLHILMEVLP